MMKTNRLRLIAFLCLALCFALIQLEFLSHKVWEIEPTSYSNAVELKVTRTWRYGFYPGHHGATLVKTRNVSEAAPENSCSDESELCAILKRELGLVPIKTILELALYLGILGYTLFASRWVSNRFIPEQGPRYLKISAEAFLWIIGWTLTLLPLIVFGYGRSLYTNWEGPGALSSSGMYLEVTLTPGMTVSYRSWLELIALLPITTFEAVGVVQLLYGMPLKLFLWIVGALFFSLIGLIVGIIKSIAASRRSSQENKAS
ncbi:MAG: hypothetical protein GY832_32575 [Chloroflexi bacterium]|nr:hypothetical protein [Chloroflexota bacterium]